MKNVVVRRVDLYKRFGGRCVYCGKPLGRSWHRDHVEPLIRHRGVRFSFSGSNGCKNPAAHRLDNIVACCKPCNLSKSNLDLETWRASLNWTFFKAPIVFWMERYRE